jgi:tetratricopeptide (TPR) repeat protein
MRDDHVRFEHYLFFTQGKMGSGEMLARMHRHLLDGCESCRRAWEGLVESERRDIADLLAEQTEPIPFDPTPPEETALASPSPYESAFSGAARQRNQEAKRLTYEKRTARRELDALLAIPAAERHQTIMLSRKRFRSAALAHLLVEEARNRVRGSWQEALELLELARQVVVWLPRAWGTDWAKELLYRVDAHRANAHRVGGSLGEAEKRFRALRRQLVAEPVLAPSLDAEVASLEASLRGDQRRFEEAVELLDQAVLVYQETGEREGLARTLIQRAAMQHYRERYDVALADLDRARGLLDPKADGFLYLCTIVGTAPVLLDLGRAEEAERVLTAAEEFEEASEPWWALRLRYLGGRAALGLGDLGRAERLLVDARDGFLAQELPQDVANASLDLALVYLHQGLDVRRLCREVAASLTALGVHRDALAALNLFQKSTVADAAAIARLAEIRRHLRAAPARRTSAQPS